MSIQTGCDYGNLNDLTLKTVILLPIQLCAIDLLSVKARVRKLLKPEGNLMMVSISLEVEILNGYWLSVEKPKLSCVYQYTM